MLLLLLLFTYCACLPLLFLLIFNFKILNIIYENEALVKIDCAKSTKDLSSNNMGQIFCPVNFVICARNILIHSFIYAKYLIWYLIWLKLEVTYLNWYLNLVLFKIEIFYLKFGLRKIIYFLDPKYENKAMDLKWTKQIYS